MGAAIRIPTTASGSCQPPSGSIAICATSSRLGEPRPQWLGRRQLADPDHELGPVRVGEAGVTQQQVVVGDRRCPAASARQRIGEQRNTGSRRVFGQRAGRRARCPVRLRRRSRRGRTGDRSPPADRVAGRRRSRTGGRRRGRCDPRAARSSSTSGSRSGKLRCTGPGRPASAVQYARQASVRIQRRPLRCGLVHPDLEEPLDRARRRA